MNPGIFITVSLATALLILLARRRAQVRAVALTGSVIHVVLSFLLYADYRAEQLIHPKAAMFLERQHDLFPSLGISLHFGVDGISVAMILLTAFVVVSGILVSWKIEKMAKEFFLLLTLLAAGAYGFFISLDLFMLFFFLEVAVIPKYLLIGIWGSGKKEYSANKLALMLMAGSAMVLVGILALYFQGDTRSFDFAVLSNTVLPKHFQQIFFPFLFFGFGIFTALFPFHTWVPDGHSSAPTAGSMFLAGISMKLGGYGCLRIATYLMPEGAREYADLVIVLSSVAILYGAFATLMQKDLKYMNAYSSISHCGFVLLGIGMLTKTAITGAVMQMVSHGLMTALFFAVIGIIYERTHTRMMSEMGGLMRVMPFSTTALFIAGLCSLGLPGLSGFVAEMTVFMGSWQNEGLFYRVATIIACMSIVVTAVYILRAIGQTAMGPLRDSFKGLGDASWNERLAVIILVAGILAIGLAPFWLNNLLAPAAEIIMNKIGVK